MRNTACIELLEPRISPAAVFTWRGAGVDPFWTNPDNWQGHTAPEPGSALVFKHKQSARYAPYGYNDFPTDTVFDSITFRSDNPLRARITLAGNGVELLDGVRGFSSAGINIGINIKLGADQTFTGSYTGRGGPFYGGIVDLNGHHLTLESRSADTGRFLHFAGGVIDTSDLKGGTVMNAGPASLHITRGTDVFHVIGKGGYLVVEDNPSATLTLEGATLRKFFHVAELTAKSGVVEASYGRSVEGDLRMGAQSTLVVSADQTASGDGRPQFSVGGAVVLNQPSLKLFVRHPILYGTETVIIENDGDDPVVGEFAGLPEGAQFLRSDLPLERLTNVSPTSPLFRITYVGGDGNDVAVIAATPPATVAADGKVATYIDVDGDVVTLTLERGRFTPESIILSAPNEFGGQELMFLALERYPFAHLDKLSIIADQEGDGDGRANVGVIRLSANIGSIVVDGDLRGLSAHSVGSLSAESLGAASRTTSDSVFGGVSVAFLKRLDIESDVATTVAISRVERFDVGGSVTGRISVASAQSIRIDGDLRGTDEPGSGLIEVVAAPYSSVHLIKIGGSLIGGSGRNSGAILAYHAGVVPNGSIDKIDIGGSVLAGHGEEAGYAGSIRSGERIGKIEVHGSIVGTDTHPVVIGANGGYLPSNDKPALGVVYVDGDVRHASFVAGSAFGFHSVASIKGIVVNGNWIAANAIAGVKPGEDHLIGTEDDRLAPARFGEKLIGHIGAIIVLGQARGTDKGGDSFGIVAQQIGFVHIDGETFALQEGPGDLDDFFYVDTRTGGPDGARSDFTIHEVGLQPRRAF